MKKVICSFLAAMTIGTTALAEVDVKSMSVDELLDLQTQIVEELLIREEAEALVKEIKYKGLRDFFPYGVFNIFRSEKGLYYFQISEKQLSFISRMERILMEAAGISITIDQEANNQTMKGIEEVQEAMN